MLHNEFTKLTGVQVSANEYAAIEIVYMNSDLNKFEFCKMWCKMNKSRVDAARVEAMIANRRAAALDTIYNMIKRWNGQKFTSSEQFEIPTCLWAKGIEVRAMISLGITEEEEAWKTIANAQMYLNKQKEIFA